MTPGLVACPEKMAPSQLQQVQLELILEADGGVLVELLVCDEHGTPLKRIATPARRAATQGSDSSLSGGSARSVSVLAAAPSCNYVSATSRIDGAASTTAAGGADSAQPSVRQPAQWGGQQQRGDWEVAQQRQRQRRQPSGQASPRDSVSGASGGSSGGGGRPGLLRTVAQLLQQLAEQEAQQPPHAACSGDRPRDAASSDAGGAGRSGPWVEEDVERLLGLELEVIRLQQALQILQLEFQSRGTMMEALEARLREAQREATAAEERASLLAEPVQALKAQCAEAERGRAEAQAALRAAQARAREAAAERAQAEKGAAAAQQQARQALQQLRKENQQLKSQINAACGNLKALGIPASKIFSRSAMAHAQLASPPDSPASAALLTDRSDASLAQYRQYHSSAQQYQPHGMPSAAAGEAKPGSARGPGPTGARARPPAVPRLQLASLQLAQQQAEAQQHELSALALQLGAAAAAAPQQQQQQWGPPLTAAPNLLHEVGLTARGSARTAACPPLQAQAGALEQPQQQGYLLSSEPAGQAPLIDLREPPSPVLGLEQQPGSVRGVSAANHHQQQQAQPPCGPGVHCTEQQASPLLHSNRTGAAREALPAGPATGQPGGPLGSAAEPLGSPVEAGSRAGCSSVEAQGCFGAGGTPAVAPPAGLACAAGAAGAPPEASVGSASVSSAEAQSEGGVATAGAPAGAEPAAGLAGGEAEAAGGPARLRSGLSPQPQIKADPLRRFSPAKKGYNGRSAAVPGPLQQLQPRQHVALLPLPLSARSDGGMIAAWRPEHGRAQQAQQRGAPVRQSFASFAGSTTPAPPPPKARPAAGSHQRLTYSQVPDFLEVKEAYHAVMAAEDDLAAKWASKLSSKSAVETSPARVEPMMRGLVQLFEESGVPMPLKRTGPCQYMLGTARVVVRLVNGRLMARSGSSNVDVFAWLGKQPVAAAGAAAAGR